MSITFDVLNLDKFRNLIELQRENIYAISITLDVLKLDKFKKFIELQL